METNLNEVHESLREIFVAPTGLKIVAKIDGKPLYGSDKLNDKYIKALSKSGRTKPFLNKIQQLVNNRVIMPCFLTKGFPRFYTWKIFGPSSIKSIAGFYEPVKTKKVYILISNNANIFGHVSNNFLAKLTIHELMHRTASKMGLSFISSFKGELGDFYRELWAELFSVSPKKLTDSIILPIVGFIFKTFELSRSKVTGSMLNHQFAVLQRTLQPLTTMPISDFDRKLADYIQIQQLFIKDIQRFFQLKGDFEHILFPIYNAYKRAFGMRNLSTLCIQELMYPSEVMAIASEQGKKKFSIKALSRIN